MISDQQGIIYSINEKEKTASIIGEKCEKSEIIIPRSIDYESNTYIVTSISVCAFDSSEIKSIQFPPDSELKTFSINSFSNSQIESLSIPSSLIELEEGWCYNMPELKKINVSPNNPRYSSYNDNKMIIGKSNIESSIFDVLVFCVRDIETVTIPSFIKKIFSFAFESCEKLLKVEIPDDSELQTIDELAFFFSSIESFTIPPHLTSIGKSAFSGCNYLKHIEIPTNSNLKTIEKEAFNNASIEKFSIPSSLVDLHKGWCRGTSKLTSIFVDPNNPCYSSYYDNKMIIGKSKIGVKNFDSIVFCVRDIEKVTIPNFIKHIFPFAFECCEKLHSIEIQRNSELLTIEEYAFFKSKIVNFTITPHLRKIGKSAFSNCSYLKKIEIPTNSNIRIIEKYAFYNTLIDSFKIPQYIMQIEKNAFASCRKLQIIEFDINIEIEKINQFGFKEYKNILIMIPN